MSYLQSTEWHTETSKKTLNRPASYQKAFEASLNDENPSSQNPTPFIELEAWSLCLDSCYRSLFYIFSAFRES